MWTVWFCCCCLLLLLWQVHQAGAYMGGRFSKQMRNSTRLSLFWNIFSMLMESAEYCWRSVVYLDRREINVRLCPFHFRSAEMLMPSSNVLGWRQPACKIWLVTLTWNLCICMCNFLSGCVVFSDLFWLYWIVTWTLQLRSITHGLIRLLHMMSWYAVTLFPLQLYLCCYSVVCILDCCDPVWFLCDLQLQWSGHRTCN